MQYLHAEVNVQLQSRQDALEAAEDACALAEAVEFPVVKNHRGEMETPGIFLGSSTRFSRSG